MLAAKKRPEEGTKIAEFDLIIIGCGGGVNVAACTEEKGTSVELESREWDYQVKEFIRKIR